MNINNKYKIILASSSPRRREILEKMGLEFEVIPSDYEEILDNADFSYQKIEELAYNKARAVMNTLKISPLTLHYSIILSADTVVVLDNEILGKPQNEEDAVSMLKRLSGRKHSVVTSVCVINSTNLEKKILSSTSYVEFKLLEDKLIRDYVEKYKPMDKAGSYGIQELPKGFVNNIEGSFENIMGLCSLVVSELLIKT